jgi:hypothetical protein
MKHQTKPLDKGWGRRVEEAVLAQWELGAGLRAWTALRDADGAVGVTHGETAELCAETAAM